MVKWYHIFFDYLDEDREFRNFLLYDNSGEFTTELSERFMEGKSLLLDGVFIPVSDIKRILIYESDKRLQETILPNGKNAIDEPNDKIMNYLRLSKVKGVHHITHKFLKEPPKKAVTNIEKSKKAVSPENIVFLVHGRNETPVLRLQKYLKKLNVNAELFEDVKEKSGSKTIIELLEYIKNNAIYAFITVTPDDYGCLREEIDKKNKIMFGKEKIEVTKICEILGCLKTRARQNVVFELGLLLGALGRNKVCCLFQKNTEEKPSDIDGILYVSFNKSVRETFSEINEKLKNVGLIK